MTKLKKCGLDIRKAPNMLSYKKILPALEAFPLSFIATADDDVYYSKKWLAQLIDGYDPNISTIHCHRAHRPRTRSDGSLLPYGEWDWEIEDARQDSLIFPTGVGGVLYPPFSLDEQVSDIELAKKLAPGADDVWLFFMARKAGTRHRKVGPRFHIRHWAGSQATSLHELNVSNGANDTQIRLMEDHFGPVTTLSPQQAESATRKSR
ncbi:MAG: hypothetical protein ACYDD1_13300 [Caulobacteraceae bacterium]